MSESSKKFSVRVDAEVYADLVVTAEDEAAAEAKVEEFIRSYGVLDMFRLTDTLEVPRDDITVAEVGEDATVVNSVEEDA